MISRGGIICAVAGLLLAAGCVADSFTLEWWTGGNKESVELVGSAGMVSGEAQNVLRQTCGFVTAKRDGETIRLASSTPAGNKFTIVLKGTKTDQGEKTRVYVEWERDIDEIFWARFTAELMHAHGQNQLTPSGGIVP
jgi:hypothetical protein